MGQHGKGLVQRVTALNRFSMTSTTTRRSSGRHRPAEQVLNNAQFRPEMMGVYVPHHIYSHIAGIDIVRAPTPGRQGEYYVLEDNLRVPSGVSYMLEDRKMMMRLFPDLFPATGGARWSPTTPTCCWTRCASRPARRARPHGGGAHARHVQQRYFEHAFLAQQMGVELVEGRTCSSGPLRLHAHHARPARVDVIYRRVDDDFLDPQVFRPTSTLLSAAPA